MDPKKKETLQDVDLYYLQRSPLLWQRLKGKLNGPVEVRTMRTALGEDLVQRYEAVCDEIESVLEILIETRADTAQEIQNHRKRREIATSLASSGIDFMNAHIRMIVEGHSDGSTSTTNLETRRPRTARTASVRHVDPLQGVPMDHLRFDKVFHESTWMVSVLRTSMEEELALLVTDADWIRELIFDERSYRHTVTQKMAEEMTATTSLSSLRTMTKRAQHAARVQALPSCPNKGKLDPLKVPLGGVAPCPSPPEKRTTERVFHRAHTENIFM